MLLDGGYARLTCVIILVISLAVWRLMDALNKYSIKDKKSSLRCGATASTSGISLSRDGTHLNDTLTSVALKRVL